MTQTKINKTAARIFSGLHSSLYKLTQGRLGGGKQDRVIVLRTTGRKSGRERDKPLFAADHADGWVVVASFSGHDTHPAWFHNLQANPDASVVTGAETHRVRARVTEGTERQELWDQMVSIFADYTEYQKVTEREIPVLVLERQAS